MPTTILNDYLRRAIERKNYQAVRQFLEEFQAVDLAELLQTEPVEAARELLMHLPVVQRAFSHDYRRCVGGTDLFLDSDLDTAFAGTLTLATLP